MAKHLSDCRVTVIGLGLMGASLCMDLVQGKLCREVRGVARRIDTVLEAFFAGAVDLAEERDQLERTVGPRQAHGDHLVVPEAVPVQVPDPEDRCYDQGDHEVPGRRGAAAPRRSGGRRRRPHR